MKAICLFSLCVFAYATLLVSCGEVENGFNTDNFSNSSNSDNLPSSSQNELPSSNSSVIETSSSSNDISSNLNWKVEQAEKVAFQYKPETGSYSLVFQDMKIEDVAIASLSSENVCGIRYGHGSCGKNYDKVEFFVNGKLHNNEVIDNNYCIFSVPVREYSESLPCGSYTFTWKITKRNKDGIPDAIVSDISKRPVKDTAYAPEFSFEGGWASDLYAKNWYLNNRDKYQGSYSLNAGWMQDEETKEVRISLPKPATKLNLYYSFSNSSSKYRDSAYIIIDDRIWNLPTNSSWSKFSTIIHSQDTVAIIKFLKREDGFSSFYVDDIRTLRYAPSAQTNGLWDFEEGFYPIEISEDWWIDNFDAYKGEYSLRSPLNADGICGFDIDVGEADSVSFWNKCSYSGVYAPKIRIGTSEDYIACNCSSSWNECKIPTRGQIPLHIETDCVSGYNRRIDYIKAW